MYHPVDCELSSQPQIYIVVRKDLALAHYHLGRSLRVSTFPTKAGPLMGKHKIR